jgi:uncharacterized iron-regulated membrane protein
LVIIVAIVAGLLVWHATRASQARLGVRSRRSQIRSLWRDVRTFAFRGALLLVLFIIVMAVALKL